MKKLYLAFSAILVFAFCLLNCGTPVPKDAIKQQFANGLTVIVKSNPDSKVLGINILGKNRSAMEPEGKTAGENHHGAFKQNDISCFKIDTNRTSYLSIRY